MQTNSTQSTNSISVRPVEIDPRILNISYSALLTLHSCPKKFQLDRLKVAKPDESTESSSNITFSFGHVVGAGAQSVLQNKNKNSIIMEAFITWKPELFAENTKQKKSFFLALRAINRLKSMLDNGYLKDWELVEYKGKPACELDFCITLPNGFRYRGSVDAVLRNKITGKVMVLELKTSSATTTNPATFKNSAQAVGYSIVLDTIFPTISSYSVLYLVYETTNTEYTQLEFSKTLYQRALWLRELILDTELITMYESAGVYPMHGESCFSFFRECEYIGLCTLDYKKLSVPYEASEKEHEYQINVTLEDLISAQFTRDAIESNENAKSNNLTHPLQTERLL
jgi:hypothetical protein